MGQQIAIYCHVSAIGQSCERQEWELKSYATKAGFEVAGVWKEVDSGSDDQRPERKKVMVLAQKRVIDAILVTELTRWGRSTFDLVQTLHDLDGWNVSLTAQTGLQFDLKNSTVEAFCIPHGRNVRVWAGFTQGAYLLRYCCCKGQRKNIWSKSWLSSKIRSTYSKCDISP